MLKLIIFDMDGLMFATEQVNCRAFMEVVKKKDITRHLNSLQVFLE